ncbi:MAG: Hsp20/alpha crystallin family protein [Opitutaceae bacterium]|jgi:HSP20 family molecular chaperone IbpA|nr:Hsp20/alpha crystallin family protein [Opitutaceae bacterium]
MHTMINPTATASSRVNATPDKSFRSPHYECAEQCGTMRLTVYVPGVEASGVEITARGPDLTVTARKTRFVRENWKSLHLENAQRDYMLRLRVGHGYDHDGIAAELSRGVLSITLPGRAPAAAIAPVLRHCFAA